MGKEKLIPLVAIAVLFIGSLSSIYVYATQIDSESIDIDGQEYSIDELFFIVGEKTIETSAEEIFTGIALDETILYVGISNPEDHDYTLIGSDGYQKTVKWENMENGVLTKERRSIFSELPKAFRVRDIVKIEVN